MRKTALLDSSSLQRAMEALAKRDPVIARAYARCGPPPPRRQPTGFSGLLRIVVAQQVSAAAAAAILARLDARLVEPRPEAFLALDDEALQAIGFSRAKIRYGRGLAHALLDRQIDLDAVAQMADEDAIAHLIRAPGIGRWTAECYLLFALGRPDVWPAGDLAVREAAGRLLGLPVRPAIGEMAAIAEPWRPWRSAAARFLWHYYRHPGAAI